MNILIIGKGGREHALCWKASQSPRVSKVFVAPGNPGMKAVAELIPISETAPKKLALWAKANDIGLTIIGPESSLVCGVADEFLKLGLLVWGPTKAAAQIEGSKDFAKTIMQKYQVATADYATFTEVAPAQAYLEQKGLPIVIKADGLAAGKGVVIPETLAEAHKTVEEMLEGNRFGSAGSRIVIEAFLEGEEFSLMAFVHRGKVLPMVMAQDHKRAYDHDQGPNTGGMGAYAPVFGAQSIEVTRVTQEIMQPVVEGLIAEQCDFTGFLYGGVILTKEGFKVIEFNARFGDPEAEVILPLLDSDLIDIIHTLLTSDQTPEIHWKDAFAIGVVLAAEGYPDAPIIGKPLNPPQDNDPDTMVFYAGVKEENGQLLSNGGRILLNVALAPTFTEAFDKVYRHMEALDVPHTFHRKDIGFKQRLR